MTRTAPAAFARLALVLGLFTSLAGLHLAFGTPAAPVAEARAEMSAPAFPGTAARAEAGYGIGGCGTGGCSADYCAAPAASDLSGYAVPCGPGRG